MFQGHFFPKSECENLGLPVVPNTKNELEIVILKDFAAETLRKNGIDAISLNSETCCHLRDFAEDTLLKNGTDINLYVGTRSAGILTDPETIFESKDFAEDTWQKNGTEANFTLDTLSAPNLKNKPYFCQYTSETGIFENQNNGETDHAFFNLYNHNFMKFSIFAHFFNNYFSNFLRSKIFVQFYQKFTQKFDFHVNINLGGRGHRFMMTLQSRISRFKVKYFEPFHELD